MIESCVINGDFNIDYSRIYDENYCNKNLFEDFDEVLSDYNIIQIVNFSTCVVQTISFGHRPNH